MAGGNTYLAPNGGNVYFGGDLYNGAGKDMIQGGNSTDWLRIYGNSFTNGIAAYNGIATDGGFYAGSWTPAGAGNVKGSGNIYFTGGGSNYLAGSLGIGTASPAGKLDIAQGTGVGVSWGSALNIYDGSYRFDIIEDTNIARFRNEGGGGYQFYNAVGSAVLANLDNSGNISFPGTVTAGGFSGTYTGTVGAANVSSGSFGANTGGGSYTFPSNVTANGSLTINGGDIYLSDTVGATKTQIKSYSNATSLWMIEPNSTAQLVLGTAHDWDKQVAVTYAPGTVGAGNGVLSIGQTQKNSSAYTQGFILLYTNGGEKMRIDPSGNVGVGVTSPGAKLDVSGNIKASGWIAAGGTTPGSNGGTSGYGINLPSTTNDSIRIIGEYADPDTSNGVFYSADNTNDGWYFRQVDCCGGGTLDYMRVARNLVYYVGEGNFGIGTAGPNYKLDVSGNARITGGLVMNYVNNGTLSVGGGSIGGNDAVGYFEDQSNNDWGIRVNKGGYDYGLKVEVGNGASYAFQVLGSGVEKVRIDGSGNAWFGGTINAGGFGGNYTGTIGAANVSSGTFGANTGGGSYTFPSNLTVNGNIYNGANYWSNSGNQWNTFYTQYGGIQLGPANSSWAHIYSTNNLNFYFNTGVAIGGQNSFFATSSGNSYIAANGGNVGVGNTGPTYKLDVSGDIHATGWVRTDGTQGWYSQTYGGGWYMQDTSWIRTYSSKSVWTDTGLLGSNGGLTVGYGGAAPPSNGAIIAGNVGIGSNGAPTKLFVNGTARITGDSEIDGGSTLYFGKEESFGGSDIGGSDYGYIRWDNDNNTYAYWGDSSENGALIIGSQNDGRTSNSDVTVLTSPAAVILDAPTVIIPNSGLDVGNGEVWAASFNTDGPIAGGTVDVTAGNLTMWGGNISIPGSSGYSIYDWTSTDANWRIGMSNDNGVVGFTRSLATSHVQYLTFASGAGQGFAVGDKVSGLSSFEVTGSGSGYKAYFRGYVGIGNASPAATLDVSGMVRATGAMSPGSGVGAELQWTGSASQLQSYNRSASTYQPLELKASAITTNASMTIGGTSKLTVSTVDPVYTIGEEKYATYGSESIGVTVDLKGAVEMLAADCGGDGVCGYVMDFGKAVKGSDLWLFAQATDLKDKLGDLMVVLTQAFDGETWYEKDAQAMTVTIYAKPNTKHEILNTRYEVSYHLSAPRFDAAEWPNTSTGDFEGLNLDKLAE